MAHRLLARLAAPAAAAAVALAPAAASAHPGTHTVTRTHPATFPVKVRSTLGTVTIPKRPVRIVSLSPTATESLFAIGAGRQVVAVDDQSDYPKRAPHTRLSGFTPNVEAIAGYRPDLVVISYDPKGLSGALRLLHIPVLLQPSARNLAGAYAQIQALGRATGHLAAARRLTTQMRTRIAAIVRATPRPKVPLTVYHEISSDGYSANSKTFIGQAYRRLGLVNIADAAPDAAGEGYPQLSSEYIVSRDPDLIVLTDGQTPQDVAARPGWGPISAVRRGMVAPVNADIASRWGPRIVGFYKVIAGRIARLVRTR